MAYDVLTCNITRGNTGKQDCTENFGVVDMFAVVPESFEIATQTLAETEATWTTAINAAKSTRLYPLFGHFNGDIEQEGRISAEGWNGKTRTVRQGKTSGTYSLDDISWYNHKQLMTFNGSTGLAAYRFTSNGYIQGWTNDDTKFLPIPLADFNVNDRTEANGEDIDYSSIFIEYKNFSYHWNENGVWVKPTAFDPLLLNGVKDVRLAGTVGATGMTLTVTGAADGVGVAGLLGANFNFYADAAPTVPITVVVGAEPSVGTYTLTWADQTGTGAMSFELFDQPVGTNGYESINILTATL
jgi:hypothetical protein